MDMPLPLEDDDILDACPFCGGSAWWKHHLNYRNYYIKCSTCNARTGNYDTDDEAFEAWQMRTHKQDNDQSPVNGLSTVQKVDAK